MSHFSVMVIGKGVERQLQPYHEYECTGTNDEFVQNIDKTDELRSEYDTATANRLRAPDGTLHSFFDEKGEWRPEFSQPDDPDSLFGIKRLRAFVPEGYEELEVPVKDLMTFAEYVAEDVGAERVVPHGQKPDINGKHAYGFALLDEEGEVSHVIRRTNPDAKWDWWVEGGRFSNFFKLRDFGGRADQCLRRDLDVEGMRADAGDKAGARWDRAMEAKVGLGYANDDSWLSWEHVRDELCKNNIGAAREMYNGQKIVQELSKALDNPWNGIDEYLTPREHYVDEARSCALSTYAILYNGQWCAKGEMGWWGMSNDDMTQREWDEKVKALLDGMPNEMLLTIIDCHI